MGNANRDAMMAPQDVAIVGLSCRFAGEASTPDKFWGMLCNGKSGHSETSRFNPQGFMSDGTRKQNTTVTTHGNFLQQDVGAFDAGFFGITPEEASAMDPQQRLMMEVAYEAFENAGLSIQQLAGSKTSCFIGNFTSDYREMLFRDPDAGPRYTVTGTGVSMLANRISWFFDLRGPSVTLNTACSSSLVALHLARRSLQSGEADIAIVGGANLLLGPEMFTFFSNLNFLSKDGLSRSFDASGEGYGRGEGVAAIILKRVDDALRKCDTIRAVVRGTGTNQDGKTKAITLPSLDAQVDLICSTYKEAGLNFQDTTYFEAHGTGTRRGDPVELEALSKTLCLDRKADSKLIVGSVKSNIGHTEATAGLAGIIKAVYMLEQGLIPANIHYDTPLPEFDLDGAKMTIPIKTMPWPGSGLRRVSINSFGFGGANAHAVLDDAASYLTSNNVHGANHLTKLMPLRNGNAKTTNGNTEQDNSEGTSTEHLFIFNAPDQQGLKRSLDAIAQHLASKSFSDSKLESKYLYDLAYTLSERRSNFKWKSVIIAASAKELIDKIHNREIEGADPDGDKNKAGSKSIDYYKKHLATDLPSYSWDHSRTYWAESRVAKEYRLRKRPPRGLIGAPQSVYVENERLWRGHLRVSEETWVQDHQVLGNTVYPAAGYVAMAIEAARDMVDRGRVVNRFNFRDVQFHSAATMKEDVPLEFMIQIRPHLTGTRDTMTSWQEFVISTCHNGKDVRKNCSGLLAIEYPAAENSASALEQVYEEEDIKEEYKRAIESCDTEQNPATLYQELASVGLQYGPAFQQISKIMKSQTCSSCEVGVFTSDSQIQGEENHVIHPATLDAMIQTIFPALVGKRGHLRAAMVPILFEELTISMETPTEPGSFFQGYSTAKHNGVREMVGTFAMLSSETLKPVVVAKGLHCSTVSEAVNPAQELNEEDNRKICSRVLWTPAIDLLSPAQQLKFIQSTSSKVENLPDQSDNLQTIQKLGKFLEALAYARTEVSVLEVGPAFEQSASSLLSMLSQELIASGALKYSTTCKDPRELQSEVDNMIAETQGFKESSFDVVVLSGESSTTLGLASLKRTIGKLLKPNGRLCLLRPMRTGVKSQPDHSLQLGNDEQLNDLLGGQDFTVDFIEHDNDGLSSGYDLVVARRKAQYHSEAFENDIMVLEGESSGAAAISDVLMSRDTAEGSYIPLPKRLLQSSLQDLNGKVCISTLEMGRAFLANATPEEFATFKEILQRCSSLLWISSSHDPLGSTVPGLARTLHNEDAALKLRTLQVPVEMHDQPEVLADVISQLALSECTDNEFRLDGGLLKVSRIIRDPDMDTSVSSMITSGNVRFKQQTLSKALQPMKLALPRQGMLDDIYFDEDKSAAYPLLDEDVEIEVRASGINFRDVLVMMGSVSDDLVGHEASGIVTRIGSKVTSVQKGDRVCTLGHGCHRSSYRTTANLVHKVPDGMSFEEAATLPLVYCTAYNALVRVARASKGQSVLIHAAAGGVGQAAIQISNYLGLEVYATVSSDAKKQLIKDTYGVLEDHIFNSRDTSFAKGVKRMTSGRGVDIVLNSLAGEQLRQSWHCLAPFGVFVEIGIRDILANTRLDMIPFAKDATFSSFEIINILHQNPKLMAQLMSAVFQLLKDQVIKPVTPVLGKPISEIGESLRLLQAGKHMGKLALIWDREQAIPIAVTTQRPILPDNATYVLVGGFGGLGQSIAAMLADRGARHLCIISRSGAQSHEAASLVQRLQDKGLEVRSICCDVSDERALKKVIEVCAKEMPPIWGVIQGAMVLRDVSFAKMTHSQWHEALRPKVDGSWNLHKLMPKDLDFFIMLSSFMGILGSRTQGNYAAAGAYQDSLAHYRRSQGLKAVSLDLGLMRDISAFSAQSAIGEFKSWQEPFGLREVDVHGLLDHVIASEMEGDQKLPAQILTGFGTVEDAEKAGIRPPYYLDDTRFALLHTNVARSEGHADDTLPATASAAPTAAPKPVSTGDLLKQASTLEEATDLVTEALIVKVAWHLEMDQADIDQREALYSYGVDSLVAIELKNWITKEFASDVSMLDIMAEEPVFEVAEKIALNSKLLSKSIVQD